MRWKGVDFVDDYIYINVLASILEKKKKSEPVIIWPHEHGSQAVNTLLSRS